MKLPRSLSAYGTASFENVLTDELEINSEELPLVDLMDNAGWLSEDAEVSVNEVTDEDHRIKARVEIFFSEDHPSGCADITHTDNYHAKFTVYIDKKTGIADFEAEDVDNTTHDEDIAEMNFDERADFDADRSEF